MTRNAEDSDFGAADRGTSPETCELVRFAATARYADLPGEVVRESRRCLLDFLGTAIGACDDEAPSLVRRQLLALGGEPQCMLLGRPERARVTDAALVNGIAAHVLDFDDTHVPTILHPTTPLYSASLALAEWKGVSGRELLAAHAVGYEIGARVSLALYPAHYDIGWHMTGTTGTIAASAAACLLLGLDARETLHGLSLSATQAAGHRGQFGSMVKSFHAGNAAANGLLSALLADSGYTGAPDPLQGRSGMFNIMATQSIPAELINGLGKRWEIFRNGVKPYACGVVAHPAIDAVLRLRTEHGIQVHELADVELCVNPLVVELTGVTAPETGLEGKFSIVFAAAIAMIDGAAGEPQFSDENVRRADVTSLMSCLRLVPSTEMPLKSARAVATLTNGERQFVKIDTAVGMPQNRISDEILTAKFHDLVDPVLGRDQAIRLRAAVEGIDRAADVSELAATATRKSAPL